MTSRYLLVLALAVAIPFAGWACSNPDAAGSYGASNGADCLPNVVLVDQNGKPVSLASLKGKLVLVDFIYTSCPGPCPRLTAKQLDVARELGSQRSAKVELVSISLDPEHDGPAQLRQYAQEHGADRDGWLFLTGGPKEIEEVLAQFGLRRERAEDGSVIHMAESYLIGPDGRQLRQYNGLAVKPERVIADIDHALGS